MVFGPFLWSFGSKLMVSDHEIASHLVIHVLVSFNAPVLVTGLFPFLWSFWISSWRFLEFVFHQFSWFTLISSINICALVNSCVINPCDWPRYFYGIGHPFLVISGFLIIDFWDLCFTTFFSWHWYVCHLLWLGELNKEYDILFGAMRFLRFCMTFMIL